MRIRLLCLLSLLVVAPHMLRAQSVGLDLNFGTEGVVVTDIDGTFDRATSVLALPDGKIVVAGSSDNETASEPHADFAVVRYNADGSLDTSFGGDGIVTTDLGTTSGSGGGGFDSVFGLLRQDDGKIIAVGVSEGDFALARYNTDGSLDASFGGDGRVVTDISGDYDQVASRAPALLLPDGKILVAGTAQGSPPTIRLVRYNPDGSLDANFGTGGIVTSDAAADPVLETVLVQSDGKMVVVANDYPDGFIEADLFVARYNADGSLDRLFGDEGTVMISASSFDRVSDAALQPDGSIVLAGFSRPGPSTGNNALLLHRFRANGTLDPDFGTAGISLLDLGPDLGFGPLVLQPDGRMVVGVSVFGAASAALTRVNADGTLDADFGTNGLLDVSLAGAGDIQDLTFQPNGQLLAAGGLDLSSPPAPPVADMLMMRFDLGLAVAVEDEVVPAAATLTLGGPNPFTAQTAVHLTLDAAGEAEIQVYDVLGRFVASLHEGPLAGGEHTLPFEAQGLPAGLYIVRARVGTWVGTRTVTLLR